LSVPVGHAERRNSESLVPTGIAQRRHREALALIAIIAAATLVRILFLGKSLWLDEGVAISDAWAGGLPLHIWGEWLHRLWHAEFNMVFYFALLRAWLRIGSGEAFIRLLSVIPAVATIPFVYALGKRLLNARAGLIAALLLAVHGAHVLYSQEARGYTLVVFLSTLSTYFFVAGVESRRPRHWAAYWLASVLSVYSHFFGGLVVVAQWVSLAWAPKKKIPWKQFVLATIAVLVCVGPAIAFVLTNKGRQVEWIAPLRLSQAVNAISEFAGNPIVLPVYLILWIVAVRRRPVPKPDEAAAEEQRWLGALIVSWLVVPFLLATAISLKRPMLVPRYLLICVPAAVLLAAKGAVSLTAKRRRIAIWTAVILSIAFIGFRYRRPKEDWRGASRYVLTHARQNDAIVVAPWWSEQPFAYYLERWPGAKPDEIKTQKLASKSALLERTLGHRRVWLVVYARPQGLTDPETSRVEAALDSEYHLTQEQPFNLVQVRLYDSPSAPH